MDPGQPRARLGTGVGSSSSHASLANMMDDVEGGDGYVAKRYNPNARKGNHPHSSSSQVLSLDGFWGWFEGQGPALRVRRVRGLKYIGDHTVMGWSL